MNTPQARRIGWRVGIISTIMSGLFALSVVLAHPQGVMAFPHIGTLYSLGILKADGGTVGYDGQFTYFIARDGAGAEPFIDGASLRYQRIIYPLFARLLAVGQADLIPYTLILINVLALGIGAGALAYIITWVGGNGYLAIAYTLWVGNLFALRFTLHEILCFTFALVAVIAYIHRRYIPAIGLLILATMTKEIGFLIAIGLALHAIFGRGKIRWASLMVGAPLLTFLLWWGFMRLWFGTLPTQYPAAKLHLIPLYGMFDALTANYEIVGTARTVNFILLTIFLGLPTVFLGVMWIKTLFVYYRNSPRRFRPIRLDENTLPLWLLLPCIGFVLTMPNVSWRDPAAAYRVGVPIVIGGMIFMAGFYPKKLKWLIAWWMPASAILLMLPEIWVGGA